MSVPPTFVSPLRLAAFAFPDSDRETRRNENNESNDNNENNENVTPLSCDLDYGMTMT